MISVSRPRASVSIPQRRWKIPWSGEEYISPHPMLRGKQWAVPGEHWEDEMLLPREPRGPYITREAAHYPTGLNRLLAYELVRAARDRLSRSSIFSGSPSPVLSTSRPPPQTLKAGQWVHLPDEARNRWLDLLRSAEWPVSARQVVQGRGACLGLSCSSWGAYISPLTNQPPSRPFSWR